MAKNLLFPFLLSILVSTSAYSNTESLTSLTRLLLVDSCEAPAPDSFRVTGAGGNFISLAWSPAWPGADHFLKVSEQDSSGGWNAIRIYSSVPDSSITVDSLESGRTYRFELSTKCENGAPSNVTVTVDFGAIVVELTLAGRTPKTPQPMACTDIPYQEYEWIGFRVFGEGASNTFEVVVNENYSGPSDPAAYIRRLITTNQIVAVDNNGNPPDDFEPIKSGVFIPFRMVRLHPNAPPETIGWIDLTVHENPKRVSVCISTSQSPWKSSYEFRPLYAHEVVIVAPGGGGQNGFATDPGKDILRVENPFSGDIRLFLPSHLNLGEVVKYKLFNTSGQIVFTQEFDPTGHNIVLPVAHLPKGMYILSLESPNISQIVKIVKSQ